MKPDSSLYRKAGVIVCLGFILAYFFAFAGPGVRNGFTHDDLMNLHRAVYYPIERHLADIALFFTFPETYRPLGSLFYRLIYDRFGFEPLPYRIACFAVLSLNVWLAYALARRLAGSREAGLLAALLIAYHPRFRWLYVSSGFCYDLLCFATYMLAFLYYLRARDRLGVLGWPQVATWSVLYVLCLNSKEMAVTLPVMILVYEWLVCPPESFSTASYTRWLHEAGRVPVVGAVMTLLFLVGRMRGPNALITMDAYHPDLRLAVYLDHARSFLRQALLDPRWLRPHIALALLLALWFVARKSGSLPLRLGLAWMLIAILPVAFILQRGLDAVVISAFGLALYVGAGLAEASRYLARRILLGTTFSQRMSSVLALRPALMFAGAAAALILFYNRHGRIDFEALATEGRYIGSVTRELRRVLPQVPKDSRILFLRDPFPQSRYGTTFLVFLCYRDPSLVVQRLDSLPHKGNTAEIEGFDILLAHEGDTMRRIRPTK